MQPLSKVGFKNNDSLNVGPSMQILFSGAVVCEIHIAEERKVVQVGPLGSNDKRMQLWIYRASESGRCDAAGHICKFWIDPAADSLNLVSDWPGSPVWTRGTYPWWCSTTAWRTSCRGGRRSPWRRWRRAAQMKCLRADFLWQTTCTPFFCTQFKAKGELSHYSFWHWSKTFFGACGVRNDTPALCAIGLRGT